MVDGRTTSLTAATNEEATAINTITRRRLVDAGLVYATTVTGMDGSAIGRGDRILTRENDRNLKLANRDTYVVAKVHRGGALTVVGEQDGRRRTLPADYVTDQVHPAYAVTDFGNQGAPTDDAGLSLTDYQQ